jgi:uncharacterized protein with LGFP repeats
VTPRLTSGGWVIASTVTALMAGCSQDAASDAINSSSPVTTTRIGTVAGYFVVQGAILEKYDQSGGPSGWLGEPTSSEKAGPNAGRLNEFQHGSIYWTPRTGAHCISGQILWTWNTDGGPAGPLGYPSSDERKVPGGTESRFEHGTISYLDGQTHIQTEPR